MTKLLKFKMKTENIKKRVNQTLTWLMKLFQMCLNTLLTEIRGL